MTICKTILQLSAHVYSHIQHMQYITAIKTSILARTETSLERTDTHTTHLTEITMNHCAITADSASSSPKFSLLTQMPPPPHPHTQKGGAWPVGGGGAAVRSTLGGHLRQQRKPSDLKAQSHHLRWVPAPFSQFLNFVEILRASLCVSSESILNRL